MYRAIKIRIYPNKNQEEVLNKTFGCCRFIYNKMLEDRRKIYEELKNDKVSLYAYNYKTEKEYKQKYPFLKEVDSKALQSEWRHLKSAYDNFFRNVKKGIKKGFPQYKSKKSTQSYTTFNINNNCKIDFDHKRLKLPKISTWISYRDERLFDERIKQMVISKTQSGKYYVSILIELENIIIPKKILLDDKIIGFDMSTSKFLITKDLELSNPRFYRNEESTLRRIHREVSRKKEGLINRKKARLKLARLYEKIYNRKKDWIHKITGLLSEHFDCVILEDLNIKGMQKFNSGISKSVSLDFSWKKFTIILKYKMEQKGKHLVLIDRYFPSSKLCSQCSFKNDELRLSDRKWMCPECNAHHDRDVNASINIKKEGVNILKKNNITIIHNDYAVGTTVNAFGEDVRLSMGEQFSMNYESTTFRKW